MIITKNVRNELFKRQELNIEFQKDKNPTFEETKKYLSDELSKPEENINVFCIKGSFGKKTFLVSADIYDSKEGYEKIKKLQMSRKQRKESAKLVEEARKEKDKE